MARPLSIIAPEWWDYTTLDKKILSDAAKLTAEDLLQMSREGFKVVLRQLRRTVFSRGFRICQRLAASRVY